MSTTAGILTVGDELLAGHIENTNGSWIASRLTERGIDVREIRIVADETTDIETAVRDLGGKYTFVITTGGLGSTPDDVTIEGVAAALSRSLVTDDQARTLVESAVADIRADYPEFDHDIEAASQYPVDATILPNEVGISPGCICANVYVLPGIPEEMEAMFEDIVEEFSGAVQSRTLYSRSPESHLNEVLETVRDRFGVQVGCYPMGEQKRIRLVSEDASVVEDAAQWLATQSEIDSRAGDESPSPEVEPSDAGQD
jgi:nicotinamide-nucleotide amidase